MPPTLERQITFEFGFALERYVERGLKAVEPAGWSLTATQTRYFLCLAETGKLVGVHRAAVELHEKADLERFASLMAVDPLDVIVGSSDFVLRSTEGPTRLAIADTKATQAERKRTVTIDPTTNRKIKTTVFEFEEPRFEWMIQSATYAIAEGAEMFGPLRFDKIDGGLDMRWYRTEDWVERVTALAKKQIALTRPGGVHPDPEPPAYTYFSGDEKLDFSLACYGCDFGACEKNRDIRRDLQEIPT